MIVGIFRRLLRSPWLYVLVLDGLTIWFPPASWQIDRFGLQVVLIDLSTIFSYGDLDAIVWLHVSRMDGLLAVAAVGVALGTLSGGALGVAVCREWRELRIVRNLASLLDRPAVIFVHFFIVGVLFQVCVLLFDSLAEIYVWSAVWPVAVLTLFPVAGAITAYVRQRDRQTALEPGHSLRERTGHHAAGIAHRLSRCLKVVSSLAIFAVVTLGSAENPSDPVHKFLYASDVVDGFLSASLITGLAMVLYAVFATSEWASGLILRRQERERLINVFC